MKSIETRQRRLERIIKTQSLVAEADLDVDVFMQLVVDTLQELTEAKGAVIELVDGDHMVYRSASRSLAQHVGLRLLRANSLSGLCVTTGQILSCEDAQTDPRVDADACRKVGVRSMVCTPLFEDRTIVGVLKVMSAEASAFDDADIEALHLMAGALGAALGRQLLFDSMTRAQAQLRASEERIRAILEYANDSVISMDKAGTILQWNRAAERMFGWTSTEVVGYDIADFIAPRSARETFVSSMLHIKVGVKRGKNSRREYLAVDRQGAEILVEVGLSINEVGGRTEFTAFLHDISERKKLEQALKEMALSDELTGLPNRRHFMEILGKVIARQRRRTSGLALMFMDLNGFKEINDTYGHQVGDFALREFAVRISRCLRVDDTVARLGGDEFAVIAEGVHTPEQSQTLAKKILATLDAPLPGTAISLDASIGINLYDETVDADQFLREADSAMYEAKKNSTDRNKIAMFTRITATP